MEKVDVYNNKREKLDIIKERENMLKGEYRISVHVWIMDDEKIWLQQRATDKKIFPNMWEQSGGGVLSGETSKVATIRECKEELNIDIKDDELIYIGSYIRVNDIVDIWLVNKEFNREKIKLQKEEVSKIKLVTFDELDSMISNGEVVPTINPSYALLKNYCNVYKRGKII